MFTSVLNSHVLSVTASSCVVIKRISGHLHFYVNGVEVKFIEDFSLCEYVANKVYGISFVYTCYRIWESVPDQEPFVKSLMRGTEDYTIRFLFSPPSLVDGDPPCSLVSNVELTLGSDHSVTLKEGERHAVVKQLE